MGARCMTTEEIIFLQQHQTGMFMAVNSAQRHRKGDPGEDWHWNCIAQGQQQILGCLGASQSIAAACHGHGLGSLNGQGLHGVQLLDMLVSQQLGQWCCSISQHPGLLNCEH